MKKILMIGSLLALTHYSYSNQKLFRLVGDVRTKIHQAMFHANQLEEQGKLREARHILVRHLYFSDEIIKRLRSLIEEMNTEVQAPQNANFEIAKQREQKIVNLDSRLKDQIKNLNKKIIATIGKVFIDETQKLISQEPTSLDSRLCTKLDQFKVQLKDFVDKINSNPSIIKSLRFLTRRIGQLDKRTQNTPLKPLLDKLREDFELAMISMNF